MLVGEPDSMTAANIDPSSRYLATGGDRQNSIHIWDLDSGRLLGTCNGNVSLDGIVWSPDGLTLASVGYLGLKLWSTRFHTELANLEPRSGFIPCGFTADGRTLVSLARHADLKFWHVPTLRELMTLEVPDAASHLQFSPDGSALAVTLGGDYNRTVKLLRAPVPTPR